MIEKGFEVLKKDGKIHVYMEFDEVLFKFVQRELFLNYHDRLSGKTELDIRDVIQDKEFKDIIEKAILQLILEAYLEERKNGSS